MIKIYVNDLPDQPSVRYYLYDENQKITGNEKMQERGKVYDFAY